MGRSDATRAFWTLLLTFLTVFPSSYNGGKAVFALVTVVAVAGALIRGERMAMREGIGAGILTSFALGLFLALYDHLLLSFAQWRQANVFLTAPLIYFLFTLLFSRRPYLGAMLKDIIYIASLLISLNALAYLIYGLKGRVYPLEFLDLDYRRGIDERGFAAYSTNNLPILCFTAPFILANVLYSGNRTRFSITVLLVSLAAAFASLRVAVAVSILGAMTAIAVVSAQVAPAMLRRRVFRKSLFIVTAFFFAGFVMVAILSRNSPRFQAFITGIYDLKLSKKMSGEDIRYMQARFWLSSWTQHPLLGHGISSTELLTSSAIKPGTVQNPYGYELTYLRLLSEIGFVPIVAYGLLVFCLTVRLQAIGVRTTSPDRRDCMSYLLGMLGFLFASGTNGYLLTFGVAWTIFFPVAYLNNLFYRIAAQEGPGRIEPGLQTGGGSG